MDVRRSLYKEKAAAGEQTKGSGSLRVLVKKETFQEDATA